MYTIQKLNKTIHTLGKKHISKAKLKRFAAGVKSFSLASFTSINEAGRANAVNRNTGESRLRRTVTDGALSDQLQTLLLAEGVSNTKGYLYCSLDHSQFGPFCIAVLAVSVRKGRAIPVWCQVNVSLGALIKPLMQALVELLGYLEHAAHGLQLVLVMDRWFGSAKLLTFLRDNGAYFIARTKSDKLVQLPWDPSWWKHQIADLSFEEVDIRYAGLDLRLVRSDFTETMKDPEPWFLLTNLPENITRRQILNRYAERFEIEETFKDAKWIQRLEWQQIRKPEVIRTILLFVFFGWWLLWRYIAKRGATTITERTKQKVHPKKKLSWFRQAWEELQRLRLTPQLLPGG